MMNLIDIGQKTYQTSYRGNKSNATDKQCKIMWCFKCNPTKHFARDCSHSKNGNAVFESDQVNMTLFNVDTPYWTLINDATISDSNTKISNLVKETFAMAASDSACSQKVDREVWFNLFFDTLSDQVKNLVRISKSNRTFSFGDGMEVKASKAVKFPVAIGSVNGVCTTVFP